MFSQIYRSGPVNEKNRFGHAALVIIPKTQRSSKFWMKLELQRPSRLVIMIFDLKRFELINRDQRIKPTYPIEVLIRKWCQEFDGHQ